MGTSVRIRVDVRENSGIADLDQGLAFEKNVAYISGAGFIWGWPGTSNPGIEVADSDRLLEVPRPEAQYRCKTKGL